VESNFRRQECGLCQGLQRRFIPPGGVHKSVEIRALIRTLGAIGPCVQGVQAGPGKARGHVHNERPRASLDGTGAGVGVASTATPGAAPSRSARRFRMRSRADRPSDCAAATSHLIVGTVPIDEARDADRDRGVGFVTGVPDQVLDVRIGIRNVPRLQGQQLLLRPDP